VEVLGDALQITATADVHRQIERFLRHWEARRRDPGKETTADPSGDPASDAIDRLLAATVTANYPQPEALESIVDVLAGQGEFPLIVDHFALYQAGHADPVLASLRVNKEPLAVALERLLHPVGLTYRVTTPAAIQITTPEVAARLARVEFYGLPSEGDAPLSPEQQIARLKQQFPVLAAEPVTTAMEYDPLGQCLMLRAPDPVQWAIRRALQGEATAKGDPQQKPDQPANAPGEKDSGPGEAANQSAG
jgi:hypothetical protein